MKTNRKGGGESPGNFTPGKGTPGTHWAEPKADLEALETEKSLSSSSENETTISRRNNQ
jgi:hypothetical protein